MTSKPIIKENYVEYIEGTIPVILSAPHGGTYDDKSIPNRKNGVFDLDNNTKELTQDILDEFFLQTNNYPYCVILNISRKKVDANREIEEATGGNEESKKIYNSFHGFIKESKKRVERRFEKGIYIDIHGQSHEHCSIEFGYLLDNEILKHEDEKLNEYQDRSSIKTMSEYSKHSFVEQLRGDSSLSGLMANRGFKAIPSKEAPYAKNGDYFEGAYNTLTYSSLDGSKVSSIQTEFPYKGCRDTKKNRRDTAKAFVESIIIFMQEHFDIDIRS